jgi:hypothetical protein
MANTSVISDVSSTLVNLLNKALAPNSAELQDLQTTIKTSPARIIVFLFEIVEDAASRNRPFTEVLQPDGSYSSMKPPMALVLKYLMTPVSGDRPTDHLLMGQMLQLFYDNALIKGPDLAGTLAEAHQALKVTLVPITLEERTRVWHAVQQPYRLSVTYDVRVVNLEAAQVERKQPVTERRLQYAGRA